MVDFTDLNLRIAGRDDSSQAFQSLRGQLTAIRGELSAIQLAASQLRSGGLADVVGFLRTGISNPFVAVAAGLTAVGAAAIMVKRDMSEITAQAKVLELTTTRFQELRNIAKDAGAGDQFAQGLQGMARALFDARSGATQLAKLYEINNLQLKDAAGNWITIEQHVRNMGELMARMPSMQEKIRLAEIAGGGAGIVPMLEKIGNSYDDVLRKSKQVGLVISREWIDGAEKFDRIVRGAYDYAVAGAKAAAVAMFSPPAGAIQGSGGVLGLDPRRLDPLQRQSLARAQERRLQEIYASGITDGGAPARNALRFASYDDPAKGKTSFLTARLPEKKEGQEEGQPTTDYFARQTDSINKHIAALTADRAAIGQTAGAHEQLRAEFALVQALERNGTIAQDAVQKFMALRESMTTVQAAAAAGIPDKYLSGLQDIGKRASDAANALASARLQSDLMFERAQLGRDEISGTVAQRLRGGGLAADDPLAGTIRLNEELKQTKDIAREALSGFVGDLRQGKSATDALAGALDRVNTRLINRFFDVGLSSLFNALGPGSNFGSQIVTAGTPGPGYARGAAFTAGRVIPFAGGGVVDRPTLFPMADGAGLMGEAGPEAILPLRKGPGGRLGVEASGGGGPHRFEISVTVNNANGDAQLRRMVRAAAYEGAAQAVAIVEAGAPARLARHEQLGT